MLFNDTADYNAHEIDLMQIIKESILKITFDALNLNYYTRVFEIEKDKKNKNLICQFRLMRILRLNLKKCNTY